jgi:hypothetical protein
MQKQNLFGTLFVFVAFITIISAGCSKTGPTGATGATGPQGSPGPTGPQGNANVQVDTFTLSSAQWLWNDDYILFTGQGSYTEWFTRYYKAAFPSVTQGVLDSGVVLVYMTPNLTNQNQWSPLSYVFDTGDGYQYNFVYVTSPGNVELEFFFTEAPSVSPPILSSYTLPSYKFKIVAVTGTMTTQMKNSQIDKTNYAQVSKFLGI